MKTLVPDTLRSSTNSKPDKYKGDIHSDKYNQSVKKKKKILKLAKRKNDSSHKRNTNKTNS